MRSIKCSCYSKAITTRTKAKKEAYKDHECVVTIQQMTPASIHEQTGLQDIKDFVFFIEIVLARDCKVMMTHPHIYHGLRSGFLL